MSLFKLKRNILVLFFLTSSFLIFAYSPLPFGYSNIKLGMTLSETKTELLKNTEFGYKGDRDVSLMPGDAKVLIETDASKLNNSSFLTQCWFQFYSEQLYIITLNINTDKVDYYSMFTTLSNKYGAPDSLDPQKATWSNDEVTITLEKPLQIKYIDNEVFDMLKNYSTIEKSAEEKNIQAFLDQF